MTKQRIRLRLTLWNGATIAVMLLGFSFAAYALLSHGTMEQIDQAVRQQLRTAVVAAQSERKLVPGTMRIAALVDEMGNRGFGVDTSGDGKLLVIRSGRGEHLETETAASGENSPNMHSGIALDLLLSIEAHETPSSDISRAQLFTVPGSDGGVRVALRTIEVAGSTLRVAATEPLDEVQELLDQARTTILIAIPILVTVALALGYLQARNALAPIAAMTTQARQIGSKNLHQRLPVANAHDELGELSITFNAVLDRVDRAMEQQRQFTADASHELRTPVAIIRSEADVALDDSDASSADYREALRVIRGGSEQLSRIVNDMFLLARADAGQATPRQVPLYLNDLVNETVRSMRALAAHRDIAIDALWGDESPFVGDDELLRRALVNLLDNAIKYSPENSTIVVNVATMPKFYRITVTDSGTGIPADARELIFDRFFRVNAARSSDISAHGTGAGLGLAIAREIVELHGGTLTLNPLGVASKATTFVIDLPIRTSSF